MDSAIVKMGLHDILNVLVSKNHNSKIGTDKNFLDHYKLIMDFFSNAKSDVKLVHINNKIDDVSEFIENYILRDILKSGKFLIYNKSTKIFEKFIFIVHDKFNTADETHEYVSYRFSNQTEFLVNILAI